MPHTKAVTTKVKPKASIGARILRAASTPAGRAAIRAGSRATGILAAGMAAYDVGRAVKEGVGALRAKREAARNKEATMHKYGSEAMATISRRIKRKGKYTPTERALSNRGRK